MRNLVIEHNIIGRDTKEQIPAIIIDGIEWGNDFDHFAYQEPERPSTYIHEEGFNKATNQWVTYNQTFLRTNKTDEQLLKEYNTL
jgi:hypothetical protein